MANTSGLDREREKRSKERYEFWKQVNLQKKLKCIKCEKIKSVNDFYLLPKKRQRFIEENITIYLTSCKPCERVRFKKEKKKRYNNLEKWSNKVFGDIKLRSKKKSKIDFHSSIIIKGIKDRAKEKGRVNDLSVVKIKEMYKKQEGLCYYSGDEMSFIQGSPDVMSVDRLDSSEGYTLSNSVLCCWVYNNMKQELKEDDFYQTIKAIYEHNFENNNR